ncbi:hypothetical protein Kpho02_70810 [Kitasatospora phosalacinea]|uniref:DUF1269 domain-containing family protein n=1 Tax=Kitasatospora phosalacinea TaxID=2065 RepID=A0A9W6QGU8_9ACTN|nr:DUF6325 family protein [Kitasatospora phosalacinea]GLW74784.1 hypothetical protein Kpho02_70810 [Kitasatospora phosalacinea]
MNDRPHDVEELGPIDYLVISFPGSRLTGEGLPLLIDLVDRGIIRVLDLTFLRKDADGTVGVLQIADLTGDGRLDLAVFEGASSGLLGDTDLAEAGALLEPGDSAAVLLYENRWAAPLATALRRADARMIAGGRIPVQDLVEVLDAIESPGSSS